MDFYFWAKKTGDFCRAPGDFSGFSRDFRGFPRVCRGGNPRIAHGFQRIPGDSRGFQRVSNGFQRICNGFWAGAGAQPASRAQPASPAKHARLISARGTGNCSAMVTAPGSQGVLQTHEARARARAPASSSWGHVMGTRWELRSALSQKTGASARETPRAPELLRKYSSIIY